MKPGSIPLLIVAALLGWFLLSPRVSHLTDCRNWARNPGLISAYNFVKAACPTYGPYGDNNSVLVYALLSPLAGSTSSTRNSDAIAPTQAAALPDTAPVPVVDESSQAPVTSYRLERPCGHICQAGRRMRTRMQLLLAR